MNLPLRRGAEPPLSADQFLSLDASALGDAWRYELVGGFPVAMAPPTREHGLILGNLVRRLQAALDAAGERQCSVGPGRRSENRAMPLAIACGFPMPSCYVATGARILSCSSK